MTILGYVIFVWLTLNIVLFYRGLIDFRAGYQAAGELDNGIAAIRWGADYILKVIDNFPILIRNRSSKFIKLYVPTRRRRRKLTKAFFMDKTAMVTKITLTGMKNSV